MPARRQLLWLLLCASCVGEEDHCSDAASSNPPRPWARRVGVEPSDDERRQRFAALRAWVFAHGGFVSDAVEYRARADGVWGLHATRAIAAGSVVARVPSALVYPGGSHFAAAREVNLLNVSRALDAETDPFWAPFLDALPASCQHPLCGLEARKDSLDAVVIETTGMADPGPVMSTFLVTPQHTQGAARDACRASCLLLQAT